MDTPTSEAHLLQQEHSSCSSLGQTVRCGTALHPGTQHDHIKLISHRDFDAPNQRASLLAHAHAGARVNAWNRLDIFIGYTAVLTVRLPSARAEGHMMFLQGQQ